MGGSYLQRRPLVDLSMVLILVVLLTGYPAMDCCDAWIMPRSILAGKARTPYCVGDSGTKRRTFASVPHAKQKEGDDDWRDFRAKLVFQYRNDSWTRDKGNDVLLSENANIAADTCTTTARSNATASTNTTVTSLLSALLEEASSSLSSWVYESGTTIETGSLIISHPIQDFAYGGLNQQYFHKSIILVVQHDDATFTKGLILNRPTDTAWFSSSTGKEQERQEQQQNVHHHSCKVWYGGDVQGIHSNNNVKQLLCLHSLSSPLANEWSYPVVKNIQCIPWELAQTLIAMGQASPQDFWLFCGYAGWDQGQLQNELDRGNWYMVAANSQTIWTLLEANQDDTSGPGARRLRFGVPAWETLMKRIGRGDAVTSDECHFEDQMLWEWAQLNLVSSANRRELGNAISSGKSVLSSRTGSTRAYAPTSVKPGTVLSASPVIPSPFLLRDQVLHQALVLVIKDDEFRSVGVLLNRPSASATTLILKEKDGPGYQDKHDFSPTSITKVSIVVRFGGRYGFQGPNKKPVFWLHYNNQALREAGVGSPVFIEKGMEVSSLASEEVEEDHVGVWFCTQEDAETAIDMGLASPLDFLVVEGVSVWDKLPQPASPTRTSVGLGAEIECGKYQVVSSSRLGIMWELLSRQEQLSTHSMDRNLKLAKSAWKTAIGIVDEDHEDDPSAALVSSSNDPEGEELADKALWRWIEQLQLKRSTT